MLCFDLIFIPCTGLSAFPFSLESGVIWLWRFVLWLFQGLPSLRCLWPWVTNLGQRLGTSCPGFASPAPCLPLSALAPKDFLDSSFQLFHCFNLGFPDSSAGKESACNAGDPSSIPGSERSAGEGIGYPLQYSGLENSMDIVHGVAKSQTRLSDFHFTHAQRKKENRIIKQMQQNVKNLLKLDIKGIKGTTLSTFLLQLDHLNPTPWFSK